MIKKLLHKFFAGFLTVCMVSTFFCSGQVVFADEAVPMEENTLSEPVSSSADSVGSSEKTTEATDGAGGAGEANKTEDSNVTGESNKTEPDSDDATKGEPASGSNSNGTNLDKGQTETDLETGDAMETEEEILEETEEILEEPALTMEEKQKMFEEQMTPEERRLLRVLLYGEEEEVEPIEELTLEEPLEGTLGECQWSLSPEGLFEIHGEDEDKDDTIRFEIEVDEQEEADKQKDTDKQKKAVDFEDIIVPWAEYSSLIKNVVAYEEIDFVDQNLFYDAYNLECIELLNTESLCYEEMFEPESLEIEAISEPLEQSEPVSEGIPEAQKDPDTITSLFSGLVFGYGTNLRDKLKRRI